MATTAEKEAEPTAAKVVDTAGDTAHDAAKATHQKWEEVKPEEKVDQAADQATKTVKVPATVFSKMQPCLSGQATWTSRFVIGAIASLSGQVSAFSGPASEQRFSHLLGCSGES